MEKMQANLRTYISKVLPNRAAIRFWWNWIQWNGLLQIWVGNTVNDILCYVAALFFRCHLTPHLNYVVDWFSELVSSISSSAVRGSDAIRRYQSWKIEARLTLIGSTVIFHCHSSRRKKDLTKKTFGTITICHLLLMMIVCNETDIFDQLWKLLFGDDLIRNKTFHWYAKVVDMENEVCMLNCFIQDHD